MDPQRGRGPDAPAHTTPIDRSCLAVLIDESGNEYPLPCTLHYDSGDPWAVSLGLNGERRFVTWVFARALLAEGVFAPIGEADVHVWPTVSARGEARVAVELASEGLTALVLVPTRTVLAFLADTEVLVPCGAESAAVDIDAALTALLRTSPGGVDGPG